MPSLREVLCCTSCVESIQKTTWDRPAGKNASEKYTSYRNASLKVLLFWYAILIIWQALSYDVYMVPLLRGIYVLRMVLLPISGVMILLAMPPRCITNKRMHSEGFQRMFTVLAWAALIIPSLISFLIPIRLMEYAIGNDVANLKGEIAIISIVVYTFATGMGAIAGITTIPKAIRDIDAYEFDNIFFLTTTTAIGVRFVFSYWLLQIWAYLDLYAIVYVSLWNIFYIIYAYGTYRRNKLIRSIIYVFYILIVIAAVITFIRSTGETYGYDFSISTIFDAIDIFIAMVFYGYFASRLTRLVALMYFVPITNTETYMPTVTTDAYIGLNDA